MSAPNAVTASMVSGAAPASATPRCSGRSTVYAAVLSRATPSARSADSSPSACASTSRYWPANISARIACHGSRAAARSSGARAAHSNMSSAHASARSPSRIAAAVPNRSGSPCQAPARCASVNRTCTVGRPRRSSEASMMSSCTSAHVWISSSALTACSTACARGPVRLATGGPPAPPGERGPHPLAAAQREVGQGVDGQREGAREVGQLGAAAGQVAREDVLDVQVHGGVDRGLGGRNFGCGRHANHGAWSARPAYQRGSAQTPLVAELRHTILHYPGPHDFGGGAYPG